MQQRGLQQVRVSVSLIFLIHGLIIATWASRIPAFQAHLHLSPAVLGRSLMMAAIGSVVATSAAGRWAVLTFVPKVLATARLKGFLEQCLSHVLADRVFDRLKPRNELSVPFARAPACHQNRDHR